MERTRQNAFVSGSGRNIGRAIALQLAAQGCNVVVNGSLNRDNCEATAEEARELGVDAFVAMGDVGRPASAAEIGRACLERFGRIDVLVNSAAIRPHKPFLELTDEDWHSVISVDLHAAFYLTRAFLPGMVANKWGRIINLTGMVAIHGYKEGAPISAAKHGAWGLAKSLAKEFGPYGITANAVSPGPIRGEGRDPAVVRYVESLAEKVPLGHIGDPNDVGGLVGYLCSDAARFITGQMIAVNGGAET